MNANVHIGTSGWSYDDWVGPFYPAGTAKGEYLGSYAERFNVVEVDSTYYRPPSARMVTGWADRTPASFRFALKAPGEITHKKILHECDANMDALIEALEPLGDKTLCVLLQFGYFNRQTFASAAPFFERLAAFLAKYVGRVPLACEIRNKNWLTGDYFALLREHRVVAALVEHAWLPPIDRVIEQHDAVTGPFAYVRLIGDRKKIELTTKTWERTVLDRSAEMPRIAGTLRHLAERVPVYTFVNNHYAGHGPATCRDLKTELEK